MTDTVVNNVTEISTLENHIDDIYYPPNWLRFDDTAEFPNSLKTGLWKIPTLVSNPENEKSKELQENIEDQQILNINEDDDEYYEPNNDEINLKKNQTNSGQQPVKSCKKIMHSIEHHYSCLPELRKRAVLPRNDSLISAEVDKGVYSLVDRGIVRAGEDLTSLVQLGSRSSKLPNLRFTKSRIHDKADTEYKISNQFSLGSHIYPGVKLVMEPIVKQKSILFPSLDSVSLLPMEKTIPPNPCSTPKLSNPSKIRNLWNSGKTQGKRYILGRDTPLNQVLTGWIIPFKDGVVFKHAQAYLEFNRRYKNTNLFLCIEWIIQNIENLLQNYGIQYADIFCEKIIALAQQPLVWPLLKEDLILCVANPDEIIEKMKDPALKFRNSAYSQQIAATLIQKAVRTWLKRMEHLQLLEKVWATAVFQKYWKIKTTGRALRASMMSRVTTESTKGCVRLINNLKRDWIQIFGSNQRVIVQVCNWMRPETASNLPNYDFSRCVPLHDPKVSMIFICPFIDPLKYQSLINLFGIKFILTTDVSHRENNPIRNGRARFLTPETASSFQQNTSMAIVTCMSQRIIREIKSHCEGKDSLLYTDSIGDWDIHLSASLQIPIYGCVPELFDLLSTKSKARKFLEATGIKLSSALLSTASDITSLLANFIKCIYTFPKARYFAFIPSAKLNLDYPAGQIPVAYIDVNSFSLKDDSSLESFAKSFTVKQAQSSNKKVPKQENFEMVEPAKKELETIVKFIKPGLKDFESFINSWKNSKGFVHAVPCSDPRKLRIIEFGFAIDANGSAELIVSTETIFDKSFGTCGFFVPQKQLPITESRSLLKKVSDHCLLLGMLGKFTLEVWTWENDNGEKEYSANNLKAYFSTTVLRGQTVVLASGCKFSSSTDKMIYDRSSLYVETKPLNKARFFNMDSAMIKFSQTVLAGIEPLENREAFYQDRLIHNTVGFIGRKTAKSFFESHGITFDYWSRTGSILPVEEGLTKSSIPIITIQKERYSCIETFLQTIDVTYSLICSKKNEQFNTYQAVTERVLYEFLLEKSQKSDLSKSELQTDMSLQINESFQDSVQILDSLEIKELSKLISKYTPISLERLMSPSDDESYPRYQVSTETVKLLAEGIPSNIEAEFDPTFHNPILLPPYKKQLKRDQSFKESSESISLKRNSADNISISSIMALDTAARHPLMPTVKEDNPENQ